MFSRKSQELGGFMEREMQVEKKLPVLTWLQHCARANTLDGDCCQPEKGLPHSFFVDGTR